ncbi:MAG: hypothetical protein PF693_18550 [Spirochaetia bacterium]|nr:hypothetical protein [Spirochaetia bacterium]
MKEICQNLNEDSQTALDKLLKFGSFPEPYIKGNELFAKRWRRIHADTIIREDILDLERVRDTL